jgi:hypothetical protein
MNGNMSTLDRRLRALVVAPAAAVIGVLIGPGSVTAIVLYALAAIVLATSAAAYCPFYALFHIGRGRRPPAAAALTLRPRKE